MKLFGSLLGLCLGTLIFTGICLAIHYGSDVKIAFFNAVNHTIRDVNFGWLFFGQYVLMVPQCFFVCLYVRIGRGIYYGSFNFSRVWLIGCTILLATIATAFLGYVLPWGQISFGGLNNKNSKPIYHNIFFLSLLIISKWISFFFHTNLGWYYKFK